MLPERDEEEQSPTERSSKWQPLLLVLRLGGRLECDCGTMAVVVVGDLSESGGLKDANYFCQECYLNWRDQAE